MKWFRTALAALAVAFGLGGAFALVQGANAYNEVKANLVEQNIVTTDDSAVPGELVASMETAIAQADVIGVHAADAVKGILGEELTYSEIPHENPDGSPLAPDQPEAIARSLLVQATSLRTALYSAAAAMGLSQLIIGFGVFLVTVGVALGAGLAVTRR